MPTISDRLEAIRRAKSLSYREIARRTGKGDSQVGRWFKGENTPGGENLQLLARALEVSVAEIADDVPVAEHARPSQHHDCRVEVPENYQLVMEIHDCLVDLGLQRQLDAMVVAVLRATGRVAEDRLERMEKVLLPPLRRRRQA